MVHLLNGITYQNFVRIERSVFVFFNMLLIILVIYLLSQSETFHCSRSEEFASVMIFAITPTYSTPLQKAELTRLSQTLILVDNIHWIVVEDAFSKNIMVETLLHHSGVSYTYLSAKTDATLYINYDQYLWSKGKTQRNLALSWLKNNVEFENINNSIVYFMDIEKSYSLKLFEEMRKVTVVGVWPVGLSHGQLWNRPLMDESGMRVNGFLFENESGFWFPMSFAGFAVHYSLIAASIGPLFYDQTMKGAQEIEFLLRLNVKLYDLQPIGIEYNDSLVWETRTKPFSTEASLRPPVLRHLQPPPRLH